jgi:hypothetical protein
MTINIRVLHTDGSVTRHTAKAPRYRRTSHAAVYVGSELRKRDQTVAALKVEGFGGYVWVGNNNTEQGEANAKAERENINW